MTDKQPYHIDLVKPGAVLHLRCGGTLPGEAVMVYDHGIVMGAIKDMSWLRSGHYYRHGPKEQPMDIVAITPKPEPKRLRGSFVVFADGKITDTFSFRADAKIHAQKYREYAIAVIDLSKIYDESGNPITEGFGL